MDDGIANGTLEHALGEPQPLALFTAPRVDYSLHRLRHYTGTRPAHFQNFVLFTNYQFYIDEFIALGQLEMQNADSPYSAFVQPGNVITRRAGLGGGDEGGGGAGREARDGAQIAGLVGALGLPGAELLTAGAGPAAVHVEPEPGRASRFTTAIAGAVERRTGAGARA